MCRICTKAIESKPPAADDLSLTGLAFERRRGEPVYGAGAPSAPLCKVCTERLQNASWLPCARGAVALKRD